MYGFLTCWTADSKSKGSMVTSTRRPVWSNIPTHLLQPSPALQPVRFFSTSRSRHNNKDNSAARLTHLTSTGSAHMVNIPPPHPSAPTQPSPDSPPQPSAPSSRSHKPPTSRLAIAISTIRFSNPTPASLIRASLVKKGDVLGVARIAGIMGAKETSRLIPLCHNIPISGVDIGVEVVEAGDDTTSTSTPSAQHEASAPDAQASPSSSSSTTTATLLAPILLNERKLLARQGAHGGVIITASVHTFGQTGVEMEALTAASVAGLTVYDMCKAVDKGMRMEGVRVVLKKGGKSGGWVEGEDGGVRRVE